MDQFLQDVLTSLQATPKYLHSKYFYDEKGDALFQQIMDCDEYYLTRCEMEIFTKQTSQLADAIIDHYSNFDVVELGAGDAVKSIHLLKELVNKKAISTYFPVDISGHIINLLEHTIPLEVPGLRIHGLNGEYLPMLAKAKNISDKIKLVLFLGSNIGNFTSSYVYTFCKELRSLLSPGDMVLIGIDLKKNPHQIRSAYDDSKGFTREFNLNLLRRINRELRGNFAIDSFEHYASYDPVTGACRSFLISSEAQQVTISGETIHFKKNEVIYMEVSQKYDLGETHEIARSCGFEPIAHFFDSNQWFADVIWKCV